MEAEGSVADDSDAFLNEPRQQKQHERFNRPTGKGWPARLAPAAARVALLVIVLGALGPTNTCDLPVYLLLAAGAFLLAGWRSRRWLPVLAVPVLAGLTGLLAVLAYLPFYQHYHVEVGSGSGNLISRFLTLTHNSSPLVPWLTVWGIFLFIAYSFVLWLVWRRGSALAGPGRVITGLAAIGLALLLFMLDRPTAALVILPLGLALVLALRRSVAAPDAFALLLLVVGLGIVGGIELLNLRDFLEGSDWYRMNTVFKFGVPSWLALGLAGSLALPRLWRSAAQGGGWLGVSWRIVTVGLLAAALFFLPFGIPARVSDRFPGPQPPIGTLDGTAYMTVGRYSWPDDRHTIMLAYDFQAIHWLLDHLSAGSPNSGSPVIAEAPAGDYQMDGAPVAYDYYRAGGLRVSSLTGLPTFVGQHQFEQRDAGAVYNRMATGQQFFRTTDQAATRQIIEDLGIEYIYVGQLERMLFTPQSLAKFENMVSAGQLRVAYRNPQVVIYQVAR